MSIKSFAENPGTKHSHGCTKQLYSPYAGITLIRYRVSSQHPPIGGAPRKFSDEQEQDANILQIARQIVFGSKKINQPFILDGCPF
jgi:hypothetical protein